MQSHHVRVKLADAGCPSRAPGQRAQFQVLKYGERRPGDVYFCTTLYHNTHVNLQLLELGQIVANFARIVPGGMVVFLPSYKTLEKVKNLWDEKGIMGSIRNKKKASSSAHWVRPCSYRHTGVHGVNSRRPRATDAVHGRDPK